MTLNIDFYFINLRLAYFSFLRQVSQNFDEALYLQSLITFK